MQFTADWLIAYLIHSTVACLSSLTIAHTLRGSPKVRDFLWKACLIVPLATATISVAVPSLALHQFPLSTVVPAYRSPTLHTAKVSVQRSGPSIGLVEVRHTSDVTLSGWIVLVIAGPAAFGTLRLARRRRIFQEKVRERKPVSIDALGVASDLWKCRDGTLRVSIADAVDSAVIVGAREVCVSNNFFTLGTAERESVIAHEVAHIQRNDRQWLGLAEWLSAAFALQPLIGVIARRLRADAEFISDEIAIGRTGNAFAFVSALTTFAEFHESSTALAYHGSQVVQRAERALARQATRDPTGLVRLSLFAAAAAIALGLLASPRITTRVPAENVHVEIRRSITPAANARIDVSVGLGAP